jgi:hypothetical protein
MQGLLLLTRGFWQGCIKLRPNPHLVGTFRGNVRAWEGTGASAKRPYLACAPRIELEAALLPAGCRQIVIIFSERPGM